MLCLHRAQYLPPVPPALVDICRVVRRYPQRNASISTQMINDEAGNSDCVLNVNSKAQQYLIDQPLKDG